MARWVSALAAVWGRALDPMATDAYLAIAERYSFAVVDRVCKDTLRSARHMPLPVEFADALRSESAAKAQGMLPANIERAGKEVARKAVEEFRRLTGQKRGGK